jgi:hypothetical protein
MVGSLWSEQAPCNKSIIITGPGVHPDGWVLLSQQRSWSQAADLQGIWATHILAAAAWIALGWLPQATGVSYILFLPALLLCTALWWITLWYCG